MPNNGNDQLHQELSEYGWERASGTLEAPAKVQLQDAVNAWLEGRLSVADAAAAVRAVVPANPSDLPLDPRKARGVEGRLFRRSGKQWLARDGSVLQP